MYYFYEKELTAIQCATQHPYLQSKSVHTKIKTLWFIISSIPTLEHGNHIIIRQIFNHLWNIHNRKRCPHPYLDRNSVCPCHCKIFHMHRHKKKKAKRIRRHRQLFLVSHFRGASRLSYRSPLLILLKSLQILTNTYIFTFLDNETVLAITLC